MPESDGSIDSNSENWSTARQDQVVAEIASALNWWTLRESGANLSFTYHVERSVPTGYEPISRPQSDEGLWIGEVMDNLGYGSGGYWTRVRDYTNAVRSGYGTDWAFIAFVADDLNDGDNMFAANPGSGYEYFAYAYLGGPFMVMTYDNDGYGNAHMDAIMAHEMGHIFLALDAYEGAGIDCHTCSGYLDAENSNSLYPSAGACGMDEQCIMRGQVSPYTAGTVSPSAREEIGWRDSDVDGLLDPIDTEVEIVVWESGSQVYPEGTSWTYQGTAFDYAWPSPKRDDVTINVITAVEYQIDGGGWSPATPTDGAWDEPLEDFTFETGILDEEDHSVTVRALNTVGNSDSRGLIPGQGWANEVSLPVIVK
jgi:hypothetical protein